MDTKKITDEAIKSIKWSVLIEFLTKTISSLVIIILAWFIMPDDYGVISIATIVISFTLIFWETGLGRYLIQTEENINEVMENIFLISILLGICIYLIIFFTAPLFAAFYQNSTIQPVIRLLGLQIIFAAFSTVQHSFLLRQLNFRKLFIIKIPVALLPGLIAVPMAMYNFGVWALVASTLIGSFVNMLLLWILNDWRPKGDVSSIPLIKKIINFSVWTIGENLVAWLLVWGDSIILGKFLGLYDLGLYRNGVNICSLLFGLLINPLISVLYSTFSRLQENQEKLHEVYLFSSKFVMLISLPVGIMIFLYGGHFLDVYFSSQWLGLGDVVKMLGLTLGITSLITINAEVYRAIGKPAINVKILLVATMVYLPAYYVFSQYGLQIFLYTRLILGIFGTLLQTYVLVKVTKIRLADIYRQSKSIVTATLLMFTSGIVFNSWSIKFSSSFPDLFLMIISIFISGAIFVFFMWIFDRSFIKYTWIKIRDMMV